MILLKHMPVHGIPLLVSEGFDIVGNTAEHTKCLLAVDVSLET